MDFSQIDHPIFIKSIGLIQAKLGKTGLDALEQQVLERLIHTTGDFEIKSLLRFSPNSCQSGFLALDKGAPILTDTSMAKAAVSPMASRTLNSEIFCALDWAPKTFDALPSRTASGIELAWKELSNTFQKPSSPIVVIGSSPSSLDTLIELIAEGAPEPSLIIGMPVGFIGVVASKEKLKKTKYPYIFIEGTRGGAAMAASVINALLRAVFIHKKK